jgi:hypothetical protein
LQLTHGVNFFQAKTVSDVCQSIAINDKDSTQGFAGDPKNPHLFQAKFTRVPYLKISGKA